MAQPTKRQYQFSPFGEAIHPWVNKPDTKFNDDGVYKMGLRVSGDDAIKLAAEIRAASEAYLEEVTAEMTPGERKKWTLYVPFKEEEDDNGNPTGAIVFDFKQNAKIKLKSGGIKEVKMNLVDGNGVASSKAIFGDSTVRTQFALRDIKMTSGKQAGVRLDFCGVQWTKLGTGSAGGGFGKVEGFEGPGEDTPSFGNASGGGATPSGDY
ncbi:hypothetical protein [Methylobacterium marchantiae]|uniref:DUF2815 family protein n=1 Tax=Methylobacterium marchantiae TaxID=600331 RepID=A0ABW3X1K3_9HYPH|nr:hypothetical protein AIGOOFII_3460 [Methylobacterium marchantiae]